MRSLRSPLRKRSGLFAGIAIGFAGALAASSMLGMTFPIEGYVADGEPLLIYTPRVLDPWKVVGVTSAVRDGKVYLYRLYENGAMDYLTPHDGPRSSLGVATWAPIPIDPKLCRPIDR